MPTREQISRQPLQKQRNRQNYGPYFLQQIIDCLQMRANRLSPHAIVVAEILFGSRDKAQRWLSKPKESERSDAGLHC